MMDVLDSLLRWQVPRARLDALVDAHDFRAIARLSMAIESTPWPNPSMQAGVVSALHALPDHAIIRLATAPEIECQLRSVHASAPGDRHVLLAGATHAERGRLGVPPPRDCWSGLGDWRWRDGVVWQAPRLRCGIPLDTASPGTVGWMLSACSPPGASARRRSPRSCSGWIRRCR